MPSKVKGFQKGTDLFLQGDLNAGLLLEACLLWKAAVVDV